MSIDAPKPFQMSEIDYADHTVEIDARSFFAHKARMESSENSGDDLSANQVNELLTACPQKPG